MNQRSYDPFRICGRLLWMTGEFILATTGFVFYVIFVSGEEDRDARATWLHNHLRRVLRNFSAHR